MLRQRLLEERGLRLAAVAPVFLAVKADVGAEDARAARFDLPDDLAVRRFEVRPGGLALRRRRLVGDDDQPEAVPAEARERVGSPRIAPRLVGVEGTVDRPVLGIDDRGVQDPVTVEQDETAPAAQIEKPAFRASSWNILTVSSEKSASGLPWSASLPITSSVAVMM